MTQIVLGALIVIAVVIAVDAVRTRRRQRLRTLDVGNIIASRIQDPATDDILVDVAGREDENVSALDLWQDLEDLVDPTLFRPRIAPGTEWKLFRLRWGNDYGMVANPAHDMHFRLEPWEIEMLPLMDGTRTVADIVIERFDGEGDLDAGAMVALVQSLHAGGFLIPRPVDVDALVAHRLDPASSARRRVREFAKTLRLEWSGADGLVTALYRGGLRYVFNPVVAVVAGAIAVGGFVAFLAVERSGRFTLGATSAPLESIALLAMGFVLTAAHELGHAVVETHNGRRIGGAGFFIYFGSPAFFVDALRRTDDEPLAADPPVRGRPGIRTRAGRDRLSGHLLLPGVGRLPGALPVRAAEPVRHLPQPDPAPGARWVLDLLRSDPSAGPASPVPRVRPARPVAQDPDAGTASRQQEWGLGLYGLVGVAVHGL